IAAIKFALPFRSKVETTLSQMDKYGVVFVVSLGMVHIDLEQTHGSILLPRSQQQRFCISLSRMRYGEGMVVVKEVMETPKPTWRCCETWLLKAKAKLVMAQGIKVVQLEIVITTAEGFYSCGSSGKHTPISLGAPGAKAFVAQTCAVILFSRVCNECTMAEDGPVVFICKEDGNVSISISSLRWCGYSSMLSRL
ncbi:hypothetical protein HID58_046951, partial [Brassica napus]